jgi:hypothetical protein
MHSTVRGRARASGIISLLKIVPCAHKTPTVSCSWSDAAARERLQVHVHNWSVTLWKNNTRRPQRDAPGWEKKAKPGGPFIFWAGDCLQITPKRCSRLSLLWTRSWLQSTENSSPPNGERIPWETRASATAAATLPRSWWVQRSNWANSLN